MPSVSHPHIGMEATPLVDDGYKPIDVNGVIPVRNSYFPFDMPKDRPASENASGHLQLELEQIAKAQTTWLSPPTGGHHRLFLAGVLRNWQQAENDKLGRSEETKSIYQGFGLDSLMCTLEDIWAAERYLQPDFDVVILHDENPFPMQTKPMQTKPTGAVTGVLGVLTGTVRTSIEGFFIQTLALHPDLFTDSTALFLAANQLVDAAIDRSLAAGARGWVVTSTYDSTATFWQRLGFSRKSGPFFTRMGYFQQPDLERPV